MRDPEDWEEPQKAGPKQARLFRIGIAFILIVVGIALLYQHFTKKDILGNYGISKAWITKYDTHPAVEDAGQDISYSYQVNGKTFTRTFSTARTLSGCEDGIVGNCAEKRFWVVYDLEDPQKSLINLEVEIQGIVSPEFPKELDHFH